MLVFIQIYIDELVFCKTNVLLLNLSSLTTFLEEFIHQEQINRDPKYHSLHTSATCKKSLLYLFHLYLRRVRSETYKHIHMYTYPYTITYKHKIKKIKKYSLKHKKAQSSTDKIKEKQILTGQIEIINNIPAFFF